jgi:tetratricopeptide (TPR) repeat protein
MSSRLFPLSALLVAALAGCATTKTNRPDKGSAEVLQFEPLIVTPGSPEEIELSGMNDEELFALGTSSFAAEDFEKASRCFSRLADLFPQSPHFAAATYNAGLAYERLRKFADALERFKVLADPAKGTDDALDASFRAAECYYHLDDYLPAIDVLTTLAAREDIPVQDQLEARVQRGICLIEAGKLDDAEKQLRESLLWWSSHKERERLDEYYPAQGQFFLGEIYRIYFENVELDPDQGEEKLHKDLEYKCQMLLSAQGHYLRAIRLGHGQWATAAGFRIGSLYETLYDAMLNARVPSELNEEEAEIYRKELRDQVRVLVTKAINVYEQTLAAAERIGAETPFVEKTRESLERMKQILLVEPAPAASAPGEEVAAPPVPVPSS